MGDPASTQLTAPPRVPWSLWDTLGVFVLTFLLAGLSYPLVGALGATEEQLVVLVLPLSLLLLAAITVGYVGARYGRGGVRMLAGPSRPRPRDASFAALAGLGAFLVINVLLAAMLAWVITQLGGEVPPVQEALRGAAAGPYPWLFAAAAVICAPLAEEVFYRGMLYPRLRDRWGRLPGIWITALLFAVAHWQAGNIEGSVLTFAILLPLAWFLTWLMDRRGTLLAPFVAHAVFNGIGVAGMFAGLA